MVWKGGSSFTFGRMEYVSPQLVWGHCSYKDRDALTVEGSDILRASNELSQRSLFMLQQTLVLI